VLASGKFGEFGEKGGVKNEKQVYFPLVLALLLYMIQPVLAADTATSMQLFITEGTVAVSNAIRYISNGRVRTLNCPAKEPGLPTSGGKTENHAGQQYHHRYQRLVQPHGTLLEQRSVVCGGDRSQPDYKN